MDTAEFCDAPHPGDVIVEPAANHTRRYILGSVEHRTQLICASRHAAIEHATRYASSHGVCVWQAHRHARFTLIFTPFHTLRSNTAAPAGADSRR